MGGDDAHSVDLGKGRVLWLFGDSFVANHVPATRRGAAMVRNSVAIQQGYNPTKASIQFYWRTQRQTDHDSLSSFFPEADSTWFWPGHGVRLENTLLIFLMKVKRVNRDLGFEVVGWEVVAIDNPDDDPPAWKLRWLNAPQNSFGVIAGSASVLSVENYLYAFSVQEPGNHDVFLVRWPMRKAAKGDLSAPFWWLGEASGWVTQVEMTQKPTVVFGGGQTEFTVHYAARAKRWQQVQTEGFGIADMAVRDANKLTGPWSGLRKFYRPTDIKAKDAFMYAGKAHPELQGADGIFTYVVNSFDFQVLLDDPSLYYPRFLKTRSVPRTKK